jgi:hypothetical protein
VPRPTLNGEFRRWIQAERRLEADNGNYVQSAELSSHTVTKVLRIISKTTAMASQLRALQHLAE